MNNGVLTSDQIDFFNKNGYLVIKNAIPANLLSKLQNRADEIIAYEKTCWGNGEVRSNNIAASNKNNNPIIFRINELFREEPPEFLELLGLPLLLNVAESLCGKDFLSTYESCLIKNADDSQKIGWHRDMQHDRSTVVITFGVYLDESRKGNGALKIIPGSQKSPEELCFFIDEMKNGNIEPVEIEVNPGDILIHDVMIVHASDAITGNKNRRTIYFEFRSTSQAKTNPGFSEEWITMRTQLINLARIRRGNCESGLHKEFAGGYSDDEKKFIEKMYNIRSIIEPGHYCLQITNKMLQNNIK